jgi:dipicolinate synthase subunit B
MEFANLNIGFAFTGSYCTLNNVIPVLKDIKNKGAKILPIMSENTFSIDTRFGNANDFIEKVEEITENKVINSITSAEPIGPNNLLDVLIIAPCTGNTLAKIANGITDTSVTMAAKAHLRNIKPLVIAISTNDGLSANAMNIGLLFCRKNIFFVPFRQDNPLLKENSLVAQMDLIIPTLKSALEGKQHQPVLLGN